MREERSRERSREMSREMSRERERGRGREVEVERASERERSRDGHTSQATLLLRFVSADKECVMTLQGRAGADVPTLHVEIIAEVRPAHCDLWLTDRPASSDAASNAHEHPRSRVHEHTEKQGCLRCAMPHLHLLTRLTRLCLSVSVSVSVCLPPSTCRVLQNGKVRPVAHR